MQKANKVGQSSGEGFGKRYVKDIHTGSRGYCFSRWRSDPLLAKYFTGQTVPRQLSAFNYREFTTIDDEEKIGEYLKYRPRPFKAKDIVKDTPDYIGSQGVSLDSDTREALEKILGGKLTSGEITSGRDSDTRDKKDRASRSNGELEV